MPTFYRILRGSVPAKEDFLPDKDAGKPRRVTPDTVRLIEGFSVYSSEIRAVMTARRFALLGTHIAEMLVDDNSSITYEKTLGPDHYTLWCTPEAAIAAVRRVLPV